MKRWLFAIALGLAAGIWEIAVRPFLPMPLAARPLLPCVVLLIVIGRPSSAAVSGLVGALLLDIFAVTPEFSFVRYAVIIVAIAALTHFVLTNRSLYVALALAIAGRLGERGSVWLIGRITDDGAASFGIELAKNWTATLVWDLAIVSAVFIVLAFVTRLFMPKVSLRRSH